MKAQTTFQFWEKKGNKEDKFTLTSFVFYRDAVGVISMIDMTKKMSTAAIHGTDPVSKVMIKKFETVSV